MFSNSILVYRKNVLDTCKIVILFFAQLFVTHTILYLSLYIFLYIIWHKTRTGTL